MQKPDQNFEELEKSLFRLMPVAFSEDTQQRMDTMLDDLAGNSKIERFDFRNPTKRFVVAGIAAALGLGIYISIPTQISPAKTVDSAPVSIISDLSPELVFLSETDRVEKVSDDGLYIDTGGSAVRKVRIRMIEESKIRDEESGIVVVLTEPREEMYMVPVSTF